ncbi:MAG TPA: sigma-70 family RNA polymerase sigma factor [Solirubrobacteraceae bacterium]
MPGGHQEARARLIEKHMGLVRSVARRYARGGEPVDDLVQVGAIGLIKAVDRFEPARGSDLRAVAVPAIEGEIRHHLRDRSQLVRTPRPVVELAGRVRRAQVEIGAREGRLPTPAEVAEALQSRSPTVELEPESAPAAPDDFADERALLQAGMSVLSKREQRILQMRYYEDRSQVEIAREIGLSQAQVSRLIRRAVDRMRAAVVDEGDEAYPREEMATREVEEPQPQQQSTHSGRLLVRMPQSLHAELARVAENEGVSLNTLITGALASSVGWRDGSVDGLAVVDAGAEDDRPAPQRPRWTSIALAANLVVVVLAAAVAIVLLVVALGHGW